MLIRIKNQVINTDTIVDAIFVEKNQRALLVLRYPVLTKSGDAQKIRFRGDEAQWIWDLLCAEAEENYADQD